MRDDKKNVRKVSGATSKHALGQGQVVDGECRGVQEDRPKGCLSGSKKYPEKRL